MNNVHFINNTIENFMQSLNDTGKLIVFGCGNQFKEALHDFIIPKDLSVEYAVDNDFRKWYSKMWDVIIFPPDKLCKNATDNTVLITSLYPFRIEDQLVDMGVENYFSYNLFVEDKMGKHQFIVML